MEIVPALPEDIPVIVENFKRHRFALQEREWLEWKYWRNPYGGTLSYKILEEGRIVGAVALLPREFSYRGQRLIGIQAVDGLMGREIRGKGLFNDVMAFLWRQRPADESVPYFFLSFPSLPASVKAHAFAGWERLEEFRLWTCLIDPGFLRRVRGLRWAPPLLRPLWRLWRSVLLAPLARGVEVLPVERFTADRTPLFPEDRVHGDRSAAFMNWRVIDNPKDRMRAFQLREGGADAGYVVIKDLGRTWEIMDLAFTAPRARYLAAFLQHVAAGGLADTVDFGVLPSSPYRRLLPRAGFVRRGAQGVLFVKRTQEIGLPAEPARWEINVLDSDW